MIIIVFAFKTLSEYLERDIGYEVERPDACPSKKCSRRNCFWKHTAYSRYVIEDDEAVLLRIQRFRCRYCHLVISCLFSFLVPYRRYSARIVSAASEIYTTAPATLPLESYRKVAGDHSCARMSVYRWTDILCTKAKRLHSQVQKEFILSGRPWQVLSAVPENGSSPSSCRAKSAKKKERLDALFLLIEITKVFLGSVTCALEGLHAHFLKNIESRQLILAGGKIAHQTQQRMGRLF